MPAMTSSQIQVFDTRKFTTNTPEEMPALSVTRSRTRSRAYPPSIKRQEPIWKALTMTYAICEERLCPLK